MGTQPAYLFRKDGKLYQAADVTVTLAPKYRTKSVRQSPIGPIRQIEQAGWDGKQLRVTPRGTLSATGRERSPGASVVPRSAAGVKAVLRRLRPSEAVVLDALDAEVRAAEAHLVELRRQREAEVRAAWAKAHVVPLKDVDP